MSILKKIFKSTFNLFLNLRYGKNNLKAESELLKYNMKFAQDVSKVEKPEEGGIEAYNDYAKYPYPGFVTSEDLDQISKYKRFIPLGIEILNKFLSSYLPKDPKEYSRPVRELYRVLTLAEDRHQQFMPKRTFKMMKNIICLLLEKDDAYRPIMQDILPEIDMSKIRMDEREEYWFCAKPYDFGGIGQKAKWDKIRDERTEYEHAEIQKTEDRIQKRDEEMFKDEEKVRKLAVELKPDLEALLEKHGIKPDFNNIAEEQVDIKIRIKKPK
jgi:hypothetical protein